MNARLKGWLGNLALVAGSLLVTLAFCELVVFRYVLVPDDVIHNVTLNGVVRYMPGTRAVMRHPDRSTSLVTINAEGWNSTKAKYQLERTPGVERIAVVGDSYVHGAFIDVDKGFPEVLEQELAQRGRRAEVLRFGIDGAPLSQYLHMLRSEVLAYKPDVVVIPIIHNDFDETYRLMHTRTGSSFMKLAKGPAGDVVEIAPTPFKRGMADRLRAFATFRYMYYETNAYLKLKWLISKLYWGGSAEWDERFISSAVDIRNLQGQAAEIRFFTSYVLAEMSKLSREQGFKLLLAMDGVREAIYQGRRVEDFEVGKLNRIMAELTRDAGIPFIDLQGVFAADWAHHRTRLEFPFDWHWNELGNDLVAVAVADALLADPRLLGREPQKAAKGPLAAAGGAATLR